jgi:Lrp/AsnC family transcriptional regulator, leucine-responsive regulatory protein
MRIINGIDSDIAMILQRNARTSNAEIARKVGLAPSAVFERIRKLEEKGVLRGFRGEVDPHAAGLPLLAFVFVRSSERAGSARTAEKIAEIPEVLEVHHVAGEDCLLVKLRAADTEALGRLLREKFGTIPTVASTRTTIVLETVKESVVLPLESASEEEPEEKRA